MKLVALCLFTFFTGTLHAQNSPTMNCTVSYKGKTLPMFWYAQGKSHHAPRELDTLSVIVQEKEGLDKIELTVVEAVADEVWDKFAETLDASPLEADMKKKIRDLGRTKVTHAYFSLYAGLFHYEHHVGMDPNIYEISCTEI